MSVLLTPHVYTSGDTLPATLMETNYFHSQQLFTLYAQTPRHKPYMVTLETPEGEVVAKLLAIVRYRSSWFPPYYYQHCRMLGEGVYAIDATATDNSTAKERTAQFGMMLKTLTAKLGPRMLYVEVSHLSQKMFGYKEFRNNRYFPVRWMSIHNSLHSRTPEERISERMKQRIDAAYQRGVVTDEVQSDADFQEFIKLLRHHNWLKPKRYIPADEFFIKLWKQTDNARLFLTRYKGHVVGCSAVVYSQRQAYLWYAAYRRKSYVFVHPDVLTIWHAIKDCHRRGYEHIFFMDVGLPFRKNSFREFILRFGGKPVSTYRWFRCSIKWANSLLSWVYRE
ncbi:MAG: GNAT family N-acetyltransferase [Prevotella sp.]|nr:GNAT family N-acetyltransferase [Prevotella sp.]